MLLQAAKALPYDDGTFSVPPENVGQIVWLVAEPPRQGKIWHRALHKYDRSCYRAVINHDGTVQIPPRSVIAASVELLAEFREFRSHQPRRYWPRHAWPREGKP